jgi:hypothetical protein
MSRLPGAAERGPPAHTVGRELPIAAAWMASFAKGRALVEKTNPNPGTVKDSAMRRLAVQQFLVQRFLVREASVQ